MSEIDIRYSEFSDGPELLKWMSDPEVLRWFPMSEGKELEDGVRNWIGFSKFKASLIATIDGKPCGIATLFLLPYKKIAHHAMFYIVVDPEHQRKGVGTSLLNNIINLGHKYFRLESVNCEIYKGCHLKKILEKSGFTSYAYQEGFVRENDEFLARELYEHFF